jgi:hypothetical protein
MKISKCFLWLSIAAFICGAFGAWTTFDYSLDCTKCLASKHVVEQKAFGITISHSTEDEDKGEDYPRIFGHPCEHVFRKGGFGEAWHSLFGSGIGCGVTGEGIFIRPRLEAVAVTYDAEQRLHDRDLTLATFQLIDTLMPADSRMPPQHAWPQTPRRTTSLLGIFLRRAETVEQWRLVLEAAYQNFPDTSKLPTE